MARTRRSFTDEFKREAVRLAEQSDSNVSKIAQDLGVDPSVLRRWVTQMRGGTWEPTAGKPLKQQEIEQLRRELAKVKTERDILKKAVGYFAKDQT